MFYRQRVFIERLVSRHLEAFASSQSRTRTVALYVVVEEFKLLKKELVINARDTAEFWFHRRWWWWRLLFALVCYGEVQMMSASKKMSDANEEKEPNNAKRGREVEKAVPTQKEVSVITEHHQRQSHQAKKRLPIFYIIVGTFEHSLASLLNLIRCVSRERKERERTRCFSRIFEKRYVSYLSSEV